MQHNDDNRKNWLSMPLDTKLVALLKTSAINMLVYQYVHSFTSKKCWETNQEIAKRLSIPDKAQVSKAVGWLKTKGLISIEKHGFYKYPNNRVIKLIYPQSVNNVSADITQSVSDITENNVSQDITQSVSIKSVKKSPQTMSHKTLQSTNNVSQDIGPMSHKTSDTDDKKDIKKEYIKKETNQNSKFADFDVFFKDLQKNNLINLDKADNPQTAYNHWYSIYKDKKLRSKLQFLAKFFKRVRADEILSNSSNPQFLKYIFGRIFSRDLLNGIRLSSLDNLDEFISQAYDWLGKDYSNGADVMDSIEDHISLEDLLDYYEAYTINHYAKLQAN